MSIREHLYLAAACSVTAMSSAAAVLIVDQGSLPSQSPSPATQIVSAAASAATHASDTSSAAAAANQGVRQPAETARLSYVALRELPLEFPRQAADETVSEPADWPEASVAAEKEFAPWGAADVRPETSREASLVGPRAAPVPARAETTAPAAEATAHDAALAARLVEIGPAATQRLEEKFRTAKAVWPPQAVTFVAIKDEKSLELHARGQDGRWIFIHRYPVLAASGGQGPKLRQGDKQVPEGVYSISFLNPDSRYHVSMRVNYPNAFDRKMAEQDHRVSLGGDIMIHGKNVSAGCLAVGDEAAEELFVLAAQTGLPNVKVVIAPTDFRRDGVPSPQPGQPVWLPKLYNEVATAMAEYKPPSTGLLSFFKF